MVRINRTPPYPMYHLRSFDNGKLIKGGLFVGQLQLMFTSQVWRGVREYFVKWMWFDAWWNEWIRGDLTLTHTGDMAEELFRRLRVVVYVLDANARTYSHNIPWHYSNVFPSPLTDRSDRHFRLHVCSVVVNGRLLAPYWPHARLIVNTFHSFLLFFTCPERHVLAL